MSYKTITIEAEVDIDDIADEVLREVSDDDLIKELTRGGLEDNVTTEYHSLKKLYFTPTDLYRHLCDICNCGYYEPKESLLNKLKDLM